MVRQRTQATGEGALDFDTIVNEVPPGEIGMHGSIHFEAARFRPLARRAGDAVIDMLAIVLLLGGGSAFAACEHEAERLCSSGDPRCLTDAAKSVEQAVADCKTPEGR